VRTTIELPDEIFRALKALAVERGISFKEVLRRAAERESRRPPPTVNVALPCY
jgi:hypothetical protein